MVDGSLQVDVSVVNGLNSSKHDGYKDPEPDRTSRRRARTGGSRIAAPILRMIFSLTGAGICYTAWLAVAISTAGSFPAWCNVALFAVAPFITALGFTAGYLIGAGITGRRSRSFVSVWIKPLAGCAAGALIAYPHGPMLIVFGMFGLGTAGLVLQEFIDRGRE